MHRFAFLDSVLRYLRQILGHCCGWSCAALTIKMCKILENPVSATLQCTSTPSSILYALPHAFFEATLYTHCCVWIRIRGTDAHGLFRLRSTVNCGSGAPARATKTTTNSTTNTLAMIKTHNSNDNQ